ncbi:proteophosphoglycan 5 [Rhodotorula toruloides]|uniref:Proteophosphoglycan 5 n=1 Tax=Rhodotorula toruloides TaxID=5286 RepID=A0A511KII0_RHOTO|nr:proteophosphoglycan 5 [Rhodotorula toruloides]
MVAQFPQGPGLSRAYSPAPRPSQTNPPSAAPGTASSSSSPASHANPSRMSPQRANTSRSHYIPLAIPSDPLASCSTTPLSSPSLSRPSALSIRPHHYDPSHASHSTTRMRARSINSGKGVAVPVQLPHLSPTLVGSPVLPAMSSFLATRRDEAQSYGVSPLARQRQEYDDRRIRFHPDVLDESSSGPNTSSAEGTEESGSTQSDTPPQTPRDEYDEVDGGGPRVWVDPPGATASNVGFYEDELEAWRTGGETDDAAQARIARTDVHTRNRSKSLEGMTRMSLRRGKSFTSLVPPSPVKERKDPFVAAVQPTQAFPPPIFEQFEPPATPGASPDAESGEGATLYPPATGSAAPPLAPSPKSLRDFVPQLAILVSLFLSSFALIAFTISTLPGLFLPHSVSDLPALTATLTTYRSSSFVAELHLFTVLTLLFLWKQCFSIPGSVLTNILFGALYGTTIGTWWACLWTAAGSTGAYAIALVIAPLVEYYFAKPLDMTRQALKLARPGLAPPPPGVAQQAVAPLSSSDLFSHLLLARFFPLLPYSVLNVISGVLRLPLGPFFTTLLIGSFPFNFATVSIGNLVALAASDPSVPLGDKIWSRQVVVKLVAVTLVSVLPLVFKDHLKRALSHGGSVAWALECAKDSLARSLFGFGAVPSVSSASTRSLSTGGPRSWKRKVSSSIGSGASDLFAFLGLQSSSRGVYERVATQGEGGTGVLDQVEMGGAGSQELYDQ